MPAPPDPRVLFDGRLNLEQQSKRAKELLRAVRAGEPDALVRLGLSHPRSPGGAAKLADAQLVIAREAGLASWPRLKAHVKALGVARLAMTSSAPDTRRTLHVRCGSDIRSVLDRAGFIGGFHEFSDPFCLGPVHDLPPDELRVERAGFISEALGLHLNNVLTRGEGEYRVFEWAARHEDVVLWFEHDSYDQLILAYLLSRLGDEIGAARPWLICVDRAPGVRDFVGLGQLAPEVIRWLWDSRRPLAKADFTLGRRVWQALAAPDPGDLFAITRSGTPKIPVMAGALLRHLRELPSARNGLSLNQQMVLDVLVERGAQQVQQLFWTLQREREPLPYLGDLMFWTVLKDMTHCAEPVIEIDAGAEEAWARRRVQITPLGRRVQAGGTDFLQVYQGRRFVGGVEVGAGRPVWRWDEALARPALC